MAKIHSIQLQILKVLLFKPKAKFSDLNTTELTNDHFSFHLKQLVQQKLVTKIPDGYKLTAQGMELAGRIDTENDQLVMQPKLGVALCLLKDTYVLLNMRKKDQAIGQVGLHTEKVRLGEKLTTTVARCVTKEIGEIKYAAKFMGISHVITVVDQSVELDVVLHCFRLDYLGGDVQLETNEVQNIWVDTTKLSDVSGLMPGVADVITNCLASKLFFIE